MVVYFHLIFRVDGSDFDPRASLIEYTLVKELGEGGFGKVMLAENKINKVMKAIKIVDANK